MGRVTTTSTGPFHLYLDIETGPGDGIEELIPEFEPPANLKDPEKIAANLARQKADWFDRAALHGMTCKILLTAYAFDDDEPEVIVGTEPVILKQVLGIAQKHLASARRLYGFNVLGFDLPVICQRATVHGIPIPKTLYGVWRGRWQWSDRVVDLAEMWAMGRRDGHASLASIAKLLGLPEKTGNGKDFARLFAENPEAAIKYAKQDIEVTRALAKRLKATEL